MRGARLPSALRTGGAGLVAVVAFAGRVAAHGGETTGLHDAPLAIALFCIGVVLVVGSLYADERSDLDRRYVDAGVALGFVAVVLGIPAYWL